MVDRASRQRDYGAAMHAEPITPADARRTWRSFGAIHGMIYFTPHALPAYAAVGVTKNRTGYFGSRVAALGAVSADVVIATFFNFNPSLFRHAMTGLWDVVTPARMLDARMVAVDASLRRCVRHSMTRC